MTAAQKKKALKKIVDEMIAIHADYRIRFAKLRRKQLLLLKEVAAGAEAATVAKLMKNIKKNKLQ